MPPPTKPEPPKIDFRPAQKAINDQHLNLRLNDTLTERYSLVTLSPNSSLDTACWHYEPAKQGNPGRHIITFGPKLAENLKEGDLGDYAQAYHRHELAHSLWTDRDLKAANEQCEKAGVPFSMFNVFEDARIEHKWRQTFDEEPFGWEAFEGPKKDPVATDELASRTMDGLMALIQNENQFEVMETRLKDLPEKEEVKAFYDRIVEAKTSGDLFPIMGEWKDKFGVPKDMPNGSSKGAGGDLSAGSKVQSDPSAKQKLMQAELNPSGDPAKDPSDDDEDGDPAIGGPSTVSGRGKGVLKGRPVDTIDSGRVQRIVEILRSAFREGERKITRESPTKRMHLRNILARKPNIYRAKEKDAPGMADIAVMVDCSGSMSGVPANCGRHIVAALGQLAREGRLAGDLIVHKGSNSGLGLSDVVPLRQVTNEVAARIPADGPCEAIDEAMKANRGKILGRSLVIAYTDGNITDAPINRSSWHGMGVFSIGAYVGMPENATKLRQWFDAPLVRNQEEGLAIALRDLIGKRVRPSQAVLQQEEERMAMAAAFPEAEASEPKRPRRGVGV